MDQQQRGGCRVLIAAAGYGKTTALRRWFSTEAARWYRCDAAVGPFIKDAVADSADQLVLDDLRALAPDDARALSEAVAEHPDMTVVVALRWPPAQRLPGPARWSERGPADLALSPEQVAEVITQEYGLTGADLAERVHDGTGGWPALVHLVAQALRLDGVPDGPLAPALTQPGGSLATYIGEEVLADLSREATRFLRQVGDLSR